MAKLTTLQPFDSVQALTHHFRTTLPCAFKSDWRLLQSPIVGHVNGVESLQGLLLATNGVLAALERSGRLEIVHVDYFIPDEQSVTIRTLVKKPLVPKANRAVAPDISEYI